MRRLKVLFYVHEWTYAGTARSHARIIEALDRTRFEPFAAYWPDGQNDLLPRLREMLGDHLIPFRRSLEKTGPEAGYTPVSHDFKSVVDRVHPDIIHHARGGYYEFPFTKRWAPLQVETNIFGERDASGYCDRSIAICNYIAERRGGADAVIYNPIPGPEKRYRNGDLRHDLGIPVDAIVCGRIGRPANFDPIAIRAFERVQKQHSNMYYLVVAPCPQFSDYVYSHRIPNVIAFAPTIDDAWIDKFHRTLGIFLHYRSDGECHSTAIAQAMMCGVPVISHRSPVFNGQEETIAGGGHVANSLDEYTSLLLNMVKHPHGTYVTAKAAQLRAMDFEQEKIVRQIEARYLEWLK